jgi:uroporphyrinogen-III synthase
MRFKVLKGNILSIRSSCFYLQKYVVYRKRKIYVGPKDFADLSPLIKKIQRRKFLFPASDQLNADAPITLNN